MILRRPLRQVVLGVLAGAVLVWVLSTGTLRGGVWVRTALLTAGYSVLMLGVCLLACIGRRDACYGWSPRRRSDPTDEPRYRDSSDSTARTS